MPQGTASEKLVYILNQINVYRNQEIKKLGSIPNDLSSVTSINVVLLNGGLQQNVIPSVIEMELNLRVSFNEDIDALETMIRQWCVDARTDVQMEIVRKDPRGNPTILDDSNPYWTVLKSVYEDLNIPFSIIVTPGSNNIKYIRSRNISAVNIGHICAHGNDEYLYEQSFLDVIGFFEDCC